jgi:hypothetical protein
LLFASSITNRLFSTLTRTPIPGNGLRSPKLLNSTFALAPLTEKLGFFNRTSQQPEWSLLLILGAPALSSLHSNIKLRVSDQTGILEERGLDARTSDTYIFTPVVGNWDEKFLVSVSLMDGVETTLPPFAFDLGR